MSCPTCDHTMQLLAGEWFWCSRCGTTMTRGGKGVAIPSAVSVARAWVHNPRHVSALDVIAQLQHMVLRQEER